MRHFLKAIICLSLITIFGLYRLNELNKIPVKIENFSTYNLVEIYTLGIIMSLAAYPLYPEISIEHLSLYKKEKTNHRSDFFLSSEVVQKAIRNYKQPTLLSWSTDAYMIGSGEARVALALNGATLKMVDEKILVEVPIRYPQNSLVELIPGIKVQEGLFWVLQEKGWYHPGVMTWVADAPQK
jgi:hypothetical protein